MDNKIITSGAIKIEKHRLHHPKSLILLEDIDTEKSKRVNNLYSPWYTHTKWWNTWTYSISFANNFVVLKKKIIYLIHQLLKLNIKVFILVLSLKYSAEIVDGNEYFL